MFKKTKTTIDYPLFFTVAFLIIFGMIMISSISIYSSYKLTSSQVYMGLIENPYNYFYVKRNILHVITGFILLVIVVKIPTKFFEKASGFFLAITTLLLGYVHFFGATYKGAKGWIDIPLLPFNIQPTELLKLSLILFLAYFFKKNIKYIKSFEKGFLPFLAILVFFVIIVGLQPDFGTVMVITPIAFVMFFLAGANVRYLTVLALIGVLGAFSIYSAGKYETKADRNKLSYITERIDFFLEDSKELFNPKSTINSDKTYQTKQALITIGSGGATGLGFGNSIQKFGYLPEVQGDFIFSVIIEELGFTGGFILLSLYLFIAYRGFYIYSKVQDIFSKLTAAGISTWFIIQAFINIGVNLNIMPLTGITLPFISYGGSSLLTLMLALGVLLGISREVHKKSKFARLKRRNIF
ncbi:MAG: putative peptidoglycan glycosyltransferase FtsW [Candidatus Gracilibacteria bacterium]|nr:putative peptidoglycan glycosyltransferase FtsW [Candidatus Gracilibacteria bacterium]MDQ7022697.1 putative peptidoglycan glycosyltransferase FtsW [Candidatus Gracilibacteria bacterium]